MDLSFSAADEAFRQEVRHFMATGLPADIRAKVANGERLSKQDHVTWQQALYRRGWIAPLWPVEYGGTG
jgi:alkylation response protein AidB-like acyl-CoA dehydrogenase